MIQYYKNAFSCARKKDAFGKNYFSFCQTATGLMPPAMRKNAVLLLPRLMAANCNFLQPPPPAEVAERKKCCC
jgi:hypothetical protein